MFYEKTSKKIICIDMLEGRNEVSNVSMYIVYSMYWFMQYVYNGTIFKILRCDTEQSLDYVHALSKKEKKCYELFLLYV